MSCMVTLQLPSVLSDGNGTGSDCQYEPYRACCIMVDFNEHPILRATLHLEAG